jgi:hypothetical protein
VRTRENADNLIAGVPVHYPGKLRLFYAGLHGSPTVLDALDNGFGTILHRVWLDGILPTVHTDCLVASDRIALGSVDMTDVLEEVAKTAMHMLEEHLEEKWRHTNCRHVQDERDLAHARALASGIYVPECAAKHCISRMQSSMGKEGSAHPLQVLEDRLTSYFDRHCNNPQQTEE